jgi:hypothetical protein
MKVFHHDHLPNSVEYNGGTYVYNPLLDVSLKSNPAIKTPEIKQLTKQAICVMVLEKQLKGRKDLHNRPYKPRPYYFTKK